MSLDRKQLLLQGCKTLSDFGIFDEHGHLSARSGPGGSTVVINGRSSPRTASLKDFAAFDLADETYPDEAPGETTIHAQIYRARDDVVAVCHNHSPYAVTVASTGLDMRPVHPNGAIQSESIAVYDELYEEGGMLVTTDEEGQAVADTLGDGAAVMLQSHGAVVVGRSVAEAVTCSIKLEFNARMLYHQALVGEPSYLPEELVEREVERIHSESGIEKSLDYYLAEGKLRR